MGVYLIKVNKFLILVIAIAFIFSVNAISAHDNVTDSVSNVNDEDVLEIDYDDLSNKETASNEDEIINLEVPVSQNPSSIGASKVTKRYVNAIEYSSTFYDSQGNPLGNTVVYCGVGSIMYGVNATTNSNGVAKFLLPLKNGNHNLYLINPDTSEIVSKNVKVFDVLKGGKNLKLYFNSGKYYSVRVYGDDGKPVGAGKKVTFTINYKKQTIKTDKNGYAKLKITFQPGTYLITATYKDFIVANKVIVKPTIIHLTQFGAKSLKKTFKFKVKLLNNNGKILKNKKIKVKFNKKTYTAKTNKKGIATFTLKTPSKAGKYNIVSSYGKAKATSQLTRYRVK